MDLSAEITSEHVEGLPLNLRNVVALATLNPSVSNTSESQQVGEGGTSGKADPDVSFLNFGGGFFRFADKHEQKTNSPTYYGTSDPGGPGNIRPNNRYSIAAGFSHIFNATTALSANAGFHRRKQGGLYQGCPFD